MEIRFTDRILSRIGRGPQLTFVLALEYEERQQVLFEEMKP
jgi:hypothetical protein